MIERRRHGEEWSHGGVDRQPRPGSNGEKRSLHKSTPIRETLWWWWWWLGAASARWIPGDPWNRPNTSGGRESGERGATRNIARAAISAAKRELAGRPARRKRGTEGPDIMAQSFFES